MINNLYNELVTLENEAHDDLMEIEEALSAVDQKKIELTIEKERTEALIERLKEEKRDL